jgi:hypothetical protein
MELVDDLTTVICYCRKMATSWAIVWIRRCPSIKRNIYKHFFF